MTSKYEINWDSEKAQNSHFDKFTSVFHYCEEIESVNFAYLSFLGNSEDSFVFFSRFMDLVIL